MGGPLLLKHLARSTAVGIPRWSPFLGMAPAA